MGEFFNRTIKDMPNSEVRRLKKDVKVSENRIYGQTKGFLEQQRKDFNEPEDDARKKMLANLEKARAARKHGKSNVPA